MLPGFGQLTEEDLHAAYRVLREQEAIIMRLQAVVEAVPVTIGDPLLPKP